MGEKVVVQVCTDSDLALQEARRKYSQLSKAKKKLAKAKEEYRKAEAKHIALKELEELRECIVNGLLEPASITAAFSLVSHCISAIR